MFIAASSHSIIARTKSAAKASMSSVRAASVFAAASLLRAGAGGPPASRRSACARVEGGDELAQIALHAALHVVPDGYLSPQFGPDEQQQLVPYAQRWMEVLQHGHLVSMVAGNDNLLWSLLCTVTACGARGAFDQLLPHAVTCG